MSSKQYPPDCGYLYMVYGHRRYVRQARTSIRSLRAVDPDARITVVTDQGDALFDEADETLLIYEGMVPKTEKEGRRDGKFEGKFYHLYDKSPYYNTFLVDCDTYFLRNCHGLFELLHDFDFAMTPTNSNLEIISLRDQNRRVKGLTPYNSGVMLYRNGRWTADVLDRTRAYYQNRRSIHKTPRMDIYFTLALSQSPASVCPLPSIYNARIGSCLMLDGPVHILHGAGKGTISADEYEEIGKKINEWEGKRFWSPNGQKLMAG